MTPISVAPWLLVALACGLDRLLGDPLWSPHPVVLMGWWIRKLRGLAEAWAGDIPWRLRLGGGVITLLLVAGSGLAGWWLEALARAQPPIGIPLLLLGMASALAGRSLDQAVRAVLAALETGDTALARQRLGWIVGRETQDLEAAEMLRAAAETASENAVDGLFAPLFWMVIGALAWTIAPDAALPGPLSLAWGFKAASTLDSMLGYRHGRLRWLGTAGARLDDGLTWIPCRLVALSLPLASGRPEQTWGWFRSALREGSHDPSPNAGVSQAAYAHAAGVRLGGLNRYSHGWRQKPLLAAGHPPPSPASVLRILQLSTRLEAIWILFSTVVLLLLGLTSG